MGKPGFPIPPPGGRVWEGYALPRSMFIPSVCGGAAWRANVNIRPRRGAWGNRVSPFPHPREGLGGLRPPRNNLIFISSVCGASRMDG